MSPLPAHQLDAKLRAARFLVWGTVAFIGLAYFRTQVVDHGKYELQSESNRLRPITLPAPRGVITDRHGNVIAENVPGYTVALLPVTEDSVMRRQLDAIAPLLRLRPADIERLLQRFRRERYQRLVVLADAPFDVVSVLEERRLMLPGLVIQTEPKRHYPDSSAVAHLVGIVGEVTDQDLAGRRPTALRQGDLIGKDGLERAYDDTLRGKDGFRVVEVSALGSVVREGGSEGLASEPGATLRTTIDLDLQRYIARVFPPGMRGAIVAVEPSSGAILALYSAPGYNPNAFVGGVSSEYWRELNVSDAHPLLDRAVQARYPPGSVWKLAIAAMALKRGVATMRTRMPIPCRGGLQYGDRFFRCWNAEGHGSLTLEQAIAQSCDVYFYQLGLKLGLTSLLEDGNAWGFRARTGVDLPGELPPAFPTGPEYFDRLYGARRWTSAVTLNLAIGQGENAQTLLSMVRLYQMLASDGKSRTPYLVRPTPEPPFDLGLSTEQLAGLRQAMINVVERGTGRSARMGELRIAGKTATSQNPQGPDHGWFIGFAPAEQPAIVVGAVIEYARHGSAVAPLVARVIAHYLGADTTAARYEFRLPNDSAPRETRVLGAPPGDSLTDSTRAPAIP